MSENPQAQNIHDTYTKWANTTLADIGPSRVKTVPLWSIVGKAKDAALRARAADLEAAYQYITTHPRYHRTECRLEINSDWGDLSLLTPSAYIEFEDDSEAPEGTYWSSTKIGWRDTASPRIGQSKVLE